MSSLNRYLNPSAKGFQGYINSQRRAFNPLIGTLRNQRAMLGKESGTEKAYNALLGALPSSDKVSSGYQTAAANLAGYIKDMKMDRAGKGVSDLLNSVGTQIGADAGQTADVANTAGMVSGMGGGQDVMSEAILSGATARFAQSEADQLSQLEGQRSELTLGAGQAKDARVDKRMEVARMLGDARSKKIASTPNPLELANSVLGFKSNQLSFLNALRNFNKSGNRSGIGKTNKPDDKPAWYKQYGFGNKPGISEKDMAQLWSMSTGAKR